MTVLSENLIEQVEKARQRAGGMDLGRLVEERRDKAPKDVASPIEKEERRRFLQQGLRDPGLSEMAFERIIEGNELQPINYLALGWIAARAICRIELFDASGVRCGWATGFLIAPEVLLTNNHVFPTQAMATRARAQFDVERDISGANRPTVEFNFQPDRLFYTNAPLDFAVSAVASSNEAGRSLLDFGFLPLIGATGKAMDGEWLTIVQHPGGQPKQVCVRENRLLTRTDDVLWYSTDTQGGSSGSPVFNNDWQVVALHHKGVPDEKNGNWQTIDGRDYDPGRDDESAIKWVANEGIRVSRIVETLRRERAGHSLLADVFDMPPERARAVTDGMVKALQRRATPAETATAPPPPSRPLPQSLARIAEAAATHFARTASPPRSSAPMSRSITLTLDIADDGSVSVRNAMPATEAAFFEAAAVAGRAQEAAEPLVDVPFDTDYAARPGYLQDFLEGSDFLIPTPYIPAQSLHRIATPLITAGRKSQNPDDYTLKYKGYSVMMHKERRLALWSAANVDGGRRRAIRRTRDEWKYDPRILRTEQIGPSYYANNQFDRGHLTRREDMEYGDTRDIAIQSAEDTCHWANCVPQHGRFNQARDLWQGLEFHILEKSVELESERVKRNDPDSKEKVRAQVFTGPVLAENDPIWDRFPDVQYPVRFWKVAATLALDEENDDRAASSVSTKLFAAGFILDQTAVIAQHGIEAAVVPFGPFSTFQVPISEIENLTGLTFRYRKTNSDDLKARAVRARPTAGRRSEVGVEEGALPVRKDPADDSKEWLYLRDVDPLARPGVRASVATRRRRLGANESFGVETIPPGYVPLTDGSSIIR